MPGTEVEITIIISNFIMQSLLDLGDPIYQNVNTYHQIHVCTGTRLC